MKPFLLLMVAVMFGSLCSSDAAAKSKVDLRSPREVLTGHWKDIDGKVNYYFTKDHVTMTDGGKVLGDFQFEIVEENTLELWVKIRLKADQANLRTVRVDFKRKGFMETLTYQGVTINNIMLYAGPEQKP